MRMKPYAVGTIKLTWIDPSNYNILKSEMFSNLESALSKAAKSNMGNNWLIFKLRQTDGKQYAWDLLPYGKHKGYLTGMQLRDNWLFTTASATLMILGAVYVYNLITEKSSQ